MHKQAAGLSFASIEDRPAYVYVRIRMYYALKFNTGSILIVVLVSSFLQ